MTANNLATVVESFQFLISKLYVYWQTKICIYQKPSNAL